MNKTRDERRAHLELSTDCDLPEWSNGRTKRRVLQTLLDLLGLTNDLESRSKTGMVLHACECDSTHGSCTNPLHLYFGTFTENMQDKPEEDRRDAAKRAAASAASTDHQSEAGKKGGASAAAMGVGFHAPGNQSKGGKKGGVSSPQQIWISLVDGFISNPSGVGAHNRSIGADKADKLRISPRDYLYLLPLTNEERLETIKQRDAQPSTCQHQSCSS